jgi:hypothetical protein
MKQLALIIAFAASLALAGCDFSDTGSTEEDSCDQELIDNITLTTMLCGNWNALGYASYDACKADKNDQILDLFLLCKIKDDNSDEKK